jgi:hypothetical protein
VACWQKLAMAWIMNGSAWLYLHSSNLRRQSRTRRLRNRVLRRTKRLGLSVCLQRLEQSVRQLRALGSSDNFLDQHNKRYDGRRVQHFFQTRSKLIEEVARCYLGATGDLYTRLLFPCKYRLRPYARLTKGSYCTIPQTNVQSYRLGSK